MTHSELRKLNRIFGEQFGFNPQGNPNFRWMRTEEMYWFVDHGDGWLENKAGVLVCERRYDRRCWADRIGKCWILAKWVFTPEAQWIAQHGDKFPWARSGEWNPVENWKLEPGEDPSIDRTLEFCAALRYHRSHSLEDWLKKDEAELKALEVSKKSELESILNDSMTVNFNRPVDPFGGMESPIGKKKQSAETLIQLAQ